MQEHLDQWDRLANLDGEALAARMRAESEQATLAYGEALAAAGHIGADWEAAKGVDPTPPWRRAADRIGGTYGVTFERMVALKSQSYTRQSKLVRRARDHVFFVLHREHGMRLAVIAVHFGLRDAGGVCKAARRHRDRLAAAG